ncbi:MAG: TRAP transporter substrate-binding protein [Candidatus Rokubacteria bacterium]|nr:TRAP transporter substrate-binding protein [Candidatus Rokubacteria bacterium]
MRVKLLASVLGALVAIFAISDIAPAQTTVRWKTVATSRPLPQFALWTWLADELDRRTKGQIKVDVVSLPELGLTGFELVRVTKAGLVDIADIILAYVAGEVPVVEAVDLPGLYPSLETSIKAHISFLQAVKRYEDKLGGVVLGGYIWPHQVIFSRKPIRSPADLRGLKIRVYGAGQTEFARALGAEGVPITFAEVYTALERGTVDAAFTGTYPGYALKWYEVTKYMVDVNHGPNSGVLVVSKRSWDRLTPEVQAILRKLGEEFSEKAWDLGRKNTKEGIDKNVEKGMEWVPMTPAMAAAVRETLAKHVLPGWVKRAGPDAKLIFNQYLAPHAGMSVP